MCSRALACRMAASGHSTAAMMQIKWLPAIHSNGRPPSSSKGGRRALHRSAIIRLQATAACWQVAPSCAALPGNPHAHGSLHPQQTQPRIHSPLPARCGMRRAWWPGTFWWWLLQRRTPAACSTEHHKSTACCAAPPGGVAPPIKNTCGELAWRCRRARSSDCYASSTWHCGQCLHHTQPDVI